MIAYVILGLALLVGLLLVARGFATANPAALAMILKCAGVFVIIILIFSLAVTGRLGVALAVAAGAAPFIMRWRALAQMIKGLNGPSPGQASGVETPFLRMSLDHDSGVLEGVVLTGQFKGRRLGDLSLEQLVTLLHECRVAGDEQSVSLVEAYLDRVHAGAWREQEGSEHGSNAAFTSARMTREEAYEILGLSEGADEKEIKEAHRRLMQKIHPDLGGSTYLAAKINQAKDLLLDD